MTSKWSQRLFNDSASGNVRPQSLNLIRPPAVQQEQELIRPAAPRYDNEPVEDVQEDDEQVSRPVSIRPATSSQQQAPQEGPGPQHQPTQPSQQLPPKKMTAPKPPPKIQSVQIESSTLIQIVKHCSEETKALSGYLLGLQTGKLLEITNSFPAVREIGGLYKDEMLKLLTETRDDSNLVGWYRSINHGLYLEENTLALQYSYQLENPSSVCIIYDPFATTKGRLSVKAIRLTEQFMKFYEGNQHGPSKISQFGLTSKNVVDELPLKLHNHHLVHAFLFEMQHKIPMNCSFERLHQSHEYQLLDTLRQLSNSIDDFEIETSAFRTYHSKSMHNKLTREEITQKHIEENKQRKARGLRTIPAPDLDKLFPKEPEPSRLKALTLIAQMSQYAEEIDTSVMQGLNKLWVTQGLHQDKPLTQ